MNRYIIERQFEHAGYTCVVIFGYSGHRCGYVGIPKENMLYGKEYSDYLDVEKKELEGELNGRILQLFFGALDNDERARIDLYFNVHGGITHSGGGEKSSYPIESNLWWFGFDCNHCNDRKDLHLAYEKFPEYRKSIQNMIDIEMLLPSMGGKVRTEEYVVNECKKLADQLKEFERKEDE